MRVRDATDVCRSRVTVVRRLVHNLPSVTLAHDFECSTGNTIGFITFLMGSSTIKASARQRFRPTPLTGKGQKMEIGKDDVAAFECYPQGAQSGTGEEKRHCEPWAGVGIVCGSGIRVTRNAKRGVGLTACNWDILTNKAHIIYPSRIAFLRRSAQCYHTSCLVLWVLFKSRSL
ncbi:hypothetical protein BJV74DRAFT_268207 [Russula compacta]|nr:hypothetical protein BJV74DRAFT_268207 [Russula compacta]